MTQWERMEAGLIYDPGDPSIMEVQNACLDRLYDFNHTRPSQGEERIALLKQMFASFGEGSWIEPPLRANWAGHFVNIGKFFYANAGLTLVDDGPITIGDRVMFGPNVTIATAGHPVDPEPRSASLQFNKPVTIGCNVWIGSGVVILPGVTIGENTVVGAGSIITKDLPANVVAVGNPCHVLRPIGEKDRKSFFRGEEIDWENVKPIMDKVLEARSKE